MSSTLSIGYGPRRNSNSRIKQFGKLVYEGSVMASGLDVKMASIISLNGTNYSTWKVQCRMALMRDGLWGITTKSELAPDEEEAEKYAKFVARRDRALATIVSSVEPSLLYLLGDPQDPSLVWEKLAYQFQ